MPEFIEFLLEFVLDFFCWGGEVWGGWRFLLPFLGSLAVAGLIIRWVPADGLRVLLSVPVIAAGMAMGVAWQVRGRPKR